MQARDLLSNALRRHGRVFVLGAGMRILFRLLPLQVPIVAGWMIHELSRNGASLHGLAASLHGPGACLAALALLTGFTAYGSDHFRRRLDRDLTGELRRRLWEAWQQASPSYRASHGLDRWQTQTLPFAGALGDLAANIAMEGLAMACRMAYPMLMLLWLDPWLALVPLGLVPVQAVLGHLATRHGRQYLALERAARQQAKRAWRESVENATALQALGASPAAWIAIENAEGAFEEHRSQRQRYERILSGGVWTVAALGLALSWWIGALRCSHGDMTVGQLVTFTGFAAFLGLPLRQFQSLSRKAAQAHDKLQEVALFLDEAGALRRPPANVPPSGAAAHVQLIGVGQSLAGIPIFDGLNAVLPAGEIIWLRGASGSGKSTLLRLLAGLEVPASGQVLLNGEPVSGHRPDVVLVERDAPVFAATLGDNLALGAPQSSARDRDHALALVQLDAFPQGLATPLGENGYRLKSTERQRLGIARALLRRPALLLLDEALTGLDETTEQALLAALARLKSTMTVVLVTPQLRSLSAIDRVMEIRQGQLTSWLAVKSEGAER